jgi:nucleotide-binding universal stress UspA family protein
MRDGAKMSCASILVHVSPSSCASHRIGLAAGLAERLGAVLIGAAARPANLVAYNNYGRLEERLIKHELKVASEEVAQAERVFRHAAAKYSAVEWRSTVGWPTRFLIEQARAADLIVVGGDLEAVRDDSRFAIDLETILMEAGRPLLIAPPLLESFPAGRAVIAWKSTREARRALRDSLPLLKLGKDVSVLAIGNDRDDTELGDLRNYLRRHGITAGVHWGDEDEASAAEQILSFAKEHGAVLVVAGGYGHSRMREWILGGVTRSLLERAPFCCLMSH